MAKRLSSATKVARVAAKVANRYVKSQGGRLKQAKNGRWVSRTKKR